MAITVNLITDSGTTSQTLASGSSVQVTPSTRVQIVVDGLVIDPAAANATVNPPHVTFTLPDGQQITLLNFVDLEGGSGGGLADADGAVTLASTLEDLSTPAAGPQAGDGGGSESNLSTFNQATFTENAEFGSGARGSGPDVAPPLDGAGDDGEPFELIIALPAPPGVEPVVIVVPLVPTPVVTPVVDTPAVDTPDTPPPTLALLIINEIGLGGNSSGTPYIEFYNDSGAFQTTAGNLVTITGPGGTPVVVALPDATIPPGGFLVIREDGSFETFDSTGASLGTGTFATAPWGMGADTTEALLVGLTFGAAVTDLFQANGLTVVGPGWIQNADGSSAVPAPFDALFNHSGFSGFSGDIDGVLSKLGLTRPVVSLDPDSGIENPHAPHSPETIVENTVFARVFGPLDGTPIDSDSESDWTTSNSPTQGGFNAAPGDINPQDGADDFDPAQNAGTNDPIVGQTVLVGEATPSLDGGEGELDGAVLEGGRGPDFLFGTPSVELPTKGTDTLAQEASYFFDEMTGGNDILAGGDHNDFLYGNTGADLLSGGVVTDTLIGGAGGADILVDFDDTSMMGLSDIYGGYGMLGDSDVLVGGNGEDLLLTRNPAEESVSEGESQTFTSKSLSKGFFGGDLLVGDNIGELTLVGEVQVAEIGETLQTLTPLFGGLSEFSGLEEGDRDVIIAGGSSDVIFGDNLGIPEGGSPDSAPSDGLLDLVSGGLSNPALSWALMGLQSDLGWRHHTNSYGEADNIDAGAGNDLVFGQGGNDEILGGSGIDVIYGGAGDDWIDVGDGLVGDSVGSAKGGELVVGDDLAVGGSALPSVFLLTDITDGPIMPPEPEVTGGNDVILGDYRGDTLIGDGIISVGPSDPFFDLVVTNAIQTDAVPIGGGGPAIAGGDDLIIGNGGSDLILGDGLVELLSNSAPWVFSLPVEGFEMTDFPSEGGTALIGGNDTLYGGAGRDVIYGEGNLSTFEFDPGDGDWMYVGKFDFLLSGAFDGHDTIYGGADGDLLYGNGGNDTLYGEEGSGDTVYGFGGDTVFGNAGDDVIYGEQDGDTLYGDDGGLSLDTRLLATDPIQGLWTEDGGVSYNDTIYGGDETSVIFTGADMILGDTIYGNLGDDLLYGGAGGDTIYGDDGLLVKIPAPNLTIETPENEYVFDVPTYNDTLYGGMDADTIYGNRGDDLIVYKVSDGEGIDVVYGDDGFGDLDNEDTFLIVNDSGGPVTVKAQPGGPLTPGVSDPSHVAVLIDGVVVANVSEVEDIVFQAGDAGDTFILYGDFGPTDVTPDTFILYGGAGNDTLDGEDLLAPHHILAYGGGGDDLLGAGGGNDELYGGDGNDTVIGRGGDDYLEGGGNDDVLSGDLGESDGFLYGTGGNDSLYGGDGMDNLVGDARDGAAYGATGGNDLLEGGGGVDVLIGDVGAGGGLLADSALDFTGLAQGHDTLYGGDDGDNLVGDVQGDLIGAGNTPGHDLLYGGDGSDFITGDADGRGAALGDGGVISGGAMGGNDTIYGEIGSDFIVGDSIDIRDGGIGGDDLIYGGSEGDSIEGDTFFDIRGDGSRGGNDTIYGEGGGDLIDGDAAQEQIGDGALGGHDLLYGGDNDDVIAGETGSKTLSLNAGSSGLLYGGVGGNDTLYGEGGNDELFGDVQGSLGASAGDLTSMAGDDTIFGGVGDDTLFGDAGLGSLGQGGSFIDNGNGGNDTLQGGVGTDTLYGGSGDDVFLYDAGDGGTLALADLIEDFADGSDLIGLTGALSALTVAGGGLTIDQSADVTGDSVFDTVISVTAGGEVLAVLSGVTATIDDTDFTVVP